MSEGGARDELFRAHAPAAYRLARRMLGNRADAEDALQEVFIEVFASIHTYRGEAPLSSWIYRITVRRALRRRRGRAPLELMPVEASPDSSAQLDSRAALRRLGRLLDRLSDNRRAIFILHEVEGHSLAEAAALLGISVTAAKKRVWRARHELERLGRSDPMLAPLFRAGRGESDE